MSLDEGDFEVAELQVQIAVLKRRIQKYSTATQKLATVVRLQRGELDASGFSFENQRLPEASAATWSKKVRERGWRRPRRRV